MPPRALAFPGTRWIGLLLTLALLLALAGPLAVPAGTAASPENPGRAPRAGFTVNSTGDGGDATPGDGACETGAGNGVCTLRAAIEETNALAGPDTIDFEPSVGLIAPNSFLPPLDDATGGTTIRGNPNWILGSFAGTGRNGLVLVSDGNKLQGLWITNFYASGVLVRGDNNVIGTDGDGVDDAAEGNLIDSNGAYGIEIIDGATGTWVAGNRIGLSDEGGDAGNVQSGVVIYDGAYANRIGTNGDGVSDELERNVISGNDEAGVALSGAGVEQNVVAGNYIGTDATGATAVPNEWAGVFISSGSANNVVGTDGDGVGDAVEGNLISGNTNVGVRLDGGSSGNVVAGNLIGTGPGGDTALPNDSSGVLVQGASTDNRIGTDADGVSDELERNVISGNGGDGVYIYTGGTAGNVVAGNYIGTNAAGDAALPNGGSGVEIHTCANNRVGGTTAAERNVLSGNGGNGVWLYMTATLNLVQGNYIGVGASGTGGLGNGRYGVALSNGVAGNTIGGTAGGAANLIANNGWGGMRVSEYVPNNWLAYDNALRANSVFSNTGLGIDLLPDGVNPNDPGDGDDGANHGQNYPTLTLAASDGSQVAIEGALNSMASTTFALDFYANSSCDPSGYGEGEIYLGTYTVTTDGSGDAGFAVALPGSVPAGYAATATATDPDGNTSEFSACFTITALCDPVHGAGFGWDPPVPIVGQVVTFTGSASGTAPLDFAWDLGDGSADAGAVVQHIYATAGDYTVLMAVTNCTGTAVVTVTHSVTVEDLPCDPVQDAAFGWTPTTPAVGQVVTFTGSAGGTAPITYTWDFGDAAAGTGAVVTHTYAATGSYVVALTASNPCGAQVLTHTVTVVGEPVCTHVQIVTVTAGIAGCAVDLAAELYGDAPFTYLWDLGDGATSALAAPTHTYTATGTYTVTLEVWNCADQGYATHTLAVTAECVPVPARMVFLPLVRR